MNKSENDVVISFYLDLNKYLINLLDLDVHKNCFRLIEYLTTEYTLNSVQKYKEYLKNVDKISRVDLILFSTPKAKSKNNWEEISLLVEFKKDNKNSIEGIKQLYGYWFTVCQALYHWNNNCQQLVKFPKNNLLISGKNFTLFYFPEEIKFDPGDKNNCWKTFVDHKNDISLLCEEKRFKMMLKTFSFNR